MSGVDTDEAIGKRLEKLRRDAGLSQGELAERLRDADLNWSQGTLSRVETGSRPMRFTEALVVSTVLGVSAEELSPVNTNLDYQIQKLRDEQKRHISTIGASRAMLREVNDGIAALTLAQELAEGRTRYSVQGSPLQFAELLSSWIPGGSGTSISSNFLRGLELIGIEYGGDPTPDVESEEDAFREIEEARSLEVARLVRAKYPRLEFSEYSEKFRVIGLTEFVEEPQNAVPGLAAYLDTPPRSWLDDFNGR